MILTSSFLDIIKNYFLDLPVEIIVSLVIMVIIAVFSIVIGNKMKKADPLAKPTTSVLLGESIEQGNSNPLYLMAKIPLLGFIWLNTSSNHTLNIGLSVLFCITLYLFELFLTIVNPLTELNACSKSAANLNLTSAWLQVFVLYIDSL